jgi:CrcB protein
MAEILFVSFGAILGANLRFKIHNKLEKINLSKDFLILIINIFSSFCLGLFLSLEEQLRALTYYYQLVLFFSIGFLGSLSTFSSFVYDIFDLCLQLKFFRAFKLFILSASIGIIAFSLGIFLSNQ